MCDVFQGMNVAIISSCCFLLLRLWGGDGNWKQLASALLLMVLAYMQKDKKQRINQCAHVFPRSLSKNSLFFNPPVCATHCNCTYLRTRQNTDISVATQALSGVFFPPDRLPGQCCDKRLFHYGNIHGWGAQAQLLMQLIGFL